MLNQQGKHYRIWVKTRRGYLKAHPPNHQGYYICYICHRWIPAGEITLDHIVSRTRAPGLRYDWDNLDVCCGTCNGEKGSRTLTPVTVDNYRDEYTEIW